MADEAKDYEQTGVVIGWTHLNMGSSIGLQIQSTVSQAALAEKRIENHRFLMTRNQAMLLAKYLLESTGQSLPAKTQPTVWRKLIGGRNK